MSASCLLDLREVQAAQARRGSSRARERTTDAPPVTGILHAAIENTGGAWVDMAHWAAAQYAIAGFDLPLSEIENLDHGQQRLGMLVAANSSKFKRKNAK